MADISVIKLPSGSDYNLKDAWAREQLQAITGGDALVFKGVTTTALSDGSTTSPIVIGGNNVTPATGNVVFYTPSGKPTQEFIWNGTSWQLFGAAADILGALAYKDSASGTVTATGTVSKPTFTGSSSTVTITTADNTSGNYQPKGTISGIAWTGASMSSTGTFTPAGSVSLTNTNKTATVSAASSGEATYTPAGTVSLTKTNKTATVAPASSGTATYTPGGTIGTPTISVKTAGTTTTIKNPTSTTVAKTVTTAAPGATAPSNSLTYYAVNGETLSLYQIGYTTGASITTSDVTVKTGDAAYQSSQPSWTGTGVRLVTDNISTADSASFSGTGARLVTGNIAVPSSASFTGTEGNVSVSGTTTGSISSQGTFTGTKAQLSGTTTAAGSVSQPTFTGDQKTVTVS